MKAIIELIDSSTSLGLVHNRPHAGRSFEDNAMVFYEKGQVGLPYRHSRSLYVKAEAYIVIQVLP